MPHPVHSSSIHLRQGGHAWQYYKPEVYEHTHIKVKVIVQLKTFHEGKKWSKDIALLFL
jgi:hypothetical protein